MPPIRSILNQPINLETNNALYSHTARTGAIHGLPTSSNVLGDATSSGRSITTHPYSTKSSTPGTVGLSHQSAPQARTYPVAFGSIPLVITAGSQNSGVYCVAWSSACLMTTVGYSIDGWGHNGYPTSLEYWALIIG